MTINEEILYFEKNMHSTNYKIQIMTMQYQIAITYALHLFMTSKYWNS